VECERLGGLRNFYSARRWLEQCKASVNSMLALRDRLSRERSGSWQLDRATDDMIIEYAAHLLSTGFWHVHTSGSATGNGGASQGGAADIKTATAAVPEAPIASGRIARTGADEKPAVKLTWIEIRLLDDDNQPVGGEAYEIRFPDGSTGAGTLSAKGNARHAGIVEGTCEVRFPNLDANEWRRA
jgi:hypothetical protein